MVQTRTGNDKSVSRQRPSGEGGQGSKIERARSRTVPAVCSRASMDEWYRVNAGSFRAARCSWTTILVAAATTSYSAFGRGMHGFFFSLASPFSRGARTSPPARDRRVRVSSASTPAPSEPLLPVHHRTGDPDFGCPRRRLALPRRRSPRRSRVPGFDRRRRRTRRRSYSIFEDFPLATFRVRRRCPPAPTPPPRRGRSPVRTRAPEPPVVCKSPT